MQDVEAEPLGISLSWPHYHALQCEKCRRVVVEVGIGYYYEPPITTVYPGQVNMTLAFREFLLAGGYNNEFRGHKYDQFI
jgi:hypothetical protein